MGKRLLKTEMKKKDNGKFSVKVFINNIVVFEYEALSFEEANAVLKARYPLPQGSLPEAVSVEVYLP